jgi:hypothetical protein
MYVNVSLTPLTCTMYCILCQLHALDLLVVGTIHTHTNVKKNRNVILALMYEIVMLTLLS